MDRLETFRQAVAGLPRHQECGVGLVLDSLDVDLRAAVDDALADPAVAHSRIAAALRQVDALLPTGRALTPQTIGRHRRGECRCAK